MSSPPGSGVELANEDVLVLTDHGEKQLKAGDTSLSRLELELLVLVSGSSNVAQLCARAAGTPAVAVVAALGGLVGKNMISLVRAGVPAADAGAGPAPTPALALEDISVGDFLKTGVYNIAPASPTPQTEREADQGTSDLQKNGYYVRIARRAAVERKPAAGARLSVVIAEDEPQLSKLLRSLFSIEGFEARTASNRAEILEALRKPPVPDLLLLDVGLGDVNGFDILGKVRNHPAFAGTAIVMLTAHATREAVLKGLAGGADGYITKPFEVEVLMKAVRAVLGIAQT